MKKWMWIPIVLLVTFLGDRAFSYVLGSLVDRADFRYSRLYTDRAEADIVLLGNSRGLNFYEPILQEQTGLRTLNLSYNAMPIDVGAALLQDYLDRYGAPQHLIVDITMLDRDNDDLVRDFRVYAPYSNRLDSLLRQRDARIWGGTKVAKLSGYGGEVAQRAFYYLTKSDRDWMVDRDISTTMIAGAETLELYKFDYTERRIQLLERVLSRYRSEGTQIALVVNPYYPPFQSTLANLGQFKSDVTATTGLPVRDYSDFVQSDKNFGDYQHLNKNGVALYLQQLIADLGL